MVETLFVLEMLAFQKEISIVSQIEGQQQNRPSEKISLPTSHDLSAERVTRAGQYTSVDC